MTGQRGPNHEHPADQRTRALLHGSQRTGLANASPWPGVLVHTDGDHRLCGRLPVILDDLDVLQAEDGDLHSAANAPPDPVDTTKLRRSACIDEVSVLLPQQRDCGHKLDL